MAKTCPQRRGSSRADRVSSLAVGAPGREILPGFPSRGDRGGCLGNWHHGPLLALTDGRSADSQGFAQGCGPGDGAGDRAERPQSDGDGSSNRNTRVCLEPPSRWAGEAGVRCRSLLAAGLRWLERRPRQKVAGRVRQGTRRGWGFVVSSRPEGEATNRCFSHIEASPHPPSLNKTPPCGGLEGARCRGPAPATGSSAAANVDVGGAPSQAPFTVRAPGGRGAGGGGGVGSPEGGAGHLGGCGRPWPSL